MTDSTISRFGSIVDAWRGGAILSFTLVFAAIGFGIGYFLTSRLFMWLLKLIVVLGLSSAAILGLWYLGSQMLDSSPY